MDWEGISESRQSAALTRAIIVQNTKGFDVVGIVSRDFSLPIAKTNLSFKVFKAFFFIKNAIKDSKEAKHLKEKSSGRLSFQFLVFNSLCLLRNICQEILMWRGGGGGKKGSRWNEL